MTHIRKMQEPCQGATSYSSHMGHGEQGAITYSHFVETE